MFQTQVLESSPQFSANLRSSDFPSWLQFDGLTGPTSPVPRVPITGLAHAAGSRDVDPPLPFPQYWPSILSFPECSQLPPAQVGCCQICWASKWDPSWKCCCSSQTIFQALTPKLEMSGILQANILIIPKGKKIWIFLWPQFQMSQGCFVWSRSWMDVSAYL